MRDPDGYIIEVDEYTQLAIDRFNSHSQLDLLLVDPIFPPVRHAQDGSRSHPRQRLTQRASRFRNGCLQLQKLLASLSQASAATGQEAILVERLPELDPGPVL